MLLFPRGVSPRGFFVARAGKSLHKGIVMPANACYNVGMKLYDECRDCLYNSQIKKVETMHPGDERLQSFKEAVRALCDGAPENSCAPLLMRGIDGVHQGIFGGIIDYSQQKQAFDGALLALEKDIYARICAAEDPVKEGIRYAMAANYIDYARLSDLGEDSIGEVLCAAERSAVDEDVYARFVTKLSGARTLVYLHDNCGEIVLDKLLIRAVKAAYPHIRVISVVRGRDIINDVTRADAERAGLSKFAAVIDSGAAIPGTYLPEVNSLTRAFINNADVIISKGLGNLETLYGLISGAFYMFMCKCGHIAARFGRRQWETVFTD